MDLERGAGLLHRLTSYSPDLDWDKPHPDPRVRQDLTSMDMDLLPPQQKDYDLPRVPLPVDLPLVDVAATAVLAGESGAAPLDLAHLARLLFLGAGVVRTTEWRGHTLMFRASGSAGGRFPLEVYVSAVGVEGLEDGVHWYDAAAHALVQVGPRAGGDTTTLVVTGVPWRTAWKYAERGFRHVYWDGGTLLAQLEAVAASAGWSPRIRTVFPDAAVTSLVGADGVHEFPLYLVTLGDGVPAVEPGSPGEPGALPQVELPLVTEAQRAGDGDALGPPWPLGPRLASAPPSDSLDAVVRRRGSQRRMDRSASVSRELLEWSMSAATRGVTVPHWVAVHAVDGVEPGVYRWPLEPVSLGDVRDELERVCLDQQLASECCFVVMSAVSFDGLDDRGYREAQLAGGLVEGRLHLAAYALGASATGMTFLDSELRDLLQADVEGLIFTCVGVPEYRSATGGTPGAPTAFRQVHSRISE